MSDYGSGYYGAGGYSGYITGLDPGDYGAGDYGVGGYGGYVTGLMPGDYGAGTYGSGPYGMAAVVVPVPSMFPPQGGLPSRRPRKIRVPEDDRADIALQDEDDAAIALVLTLT